MLEEALGENRANFQRHGYHADVLRDSILETVPQGWRGRLIPVPDCPTAFALEPSDLAAVNDLFSQNSGKATPSFPNCLGRASKAVISSTPPLDRVGMASDANGVHYCPKERIEKPPLTVGIGVWPVLEASGLDWRNKFQCL